MAAAPAASAPAPNGPKYPWLAARAEALRSTNERIQAAVKVLVPDPTALPEGRPDDATNPAAAATGDSAAAPTDTRDSVQRRYGVRPEHM